jgi:hypothetical protein
MNYPMKKVTLLFFAFIGLTNMANAQWQQTHGPFGGIVNCFTACGNTLFAGTSYNLYTSSDNGLNWSEARTGLGNPSVQSLASNGTQVFSGT